MNVSRGTSVALYSGGVDSYCMAYLCEPEILLHVLMAGRYGLQERTALETPPGMEPRLECVDLSDLGLFELANSKVIPGRNAALALVASNYSDEILMGSVDSSTGHDKDEGFAARMNGLFDWMYQPARWLPEGRKVRLRLPLYGLTKTQLVGQVLARGHDGQELADRTFSCYEPSGVHPCGRCPPCGRKWMAFSVYGIEVGYRGRMAIEHYYREWRSGRGFQRSAQFTQDMLDAWNGTPRPLPAVEPIDRLGPEYRLVGV